MASVNGWSLEVFSPPYLFECQFRTHSSNMPGGETPMKKTLVALLLVLGMPTLAMADAIVSGTATRVG